MHHTAQPALDDLGDVIRILRSSSRNERAIRQLQRVKRLVSDLGMEAVETETMLHYIGQYFPYSMDDFSPSEDTTRQ